jgi:hypothetical protein
MPELEFAFQDLESASSGLEGSSYAAQSCLNAWLKDGGKAKKSRVWKLRAYAVNIVARRLKLNEKCMQGLEKTHSGGGDHALYHSISLSTSSSIIFGGLSACYIIVQALMQTQVEHGHRNNPYVHRFLPRQERNCF